MANIGGKYFAPKPGRFGIMPEMLVAGSQNSTAIVSTTATTQWNFTTPLRKIRCLRFSASTRNTPGVVSATGTLPCTIKKISASGATTTALTSAFDLTTLVSNVVKGFTILTTLNPPDLVLQEGDVLQAVISTSLTITTLPVDLAIMAEVDIAE